MKSSFAESYDAHVAERASQGVVPRPLDAAQCAQVVELCKAPPAGEEDFLLDLLTNRVPPGVDEAAYVKVREERERTTHRVRLCSHYAACCCAGWLPGCLSEGGDYLAHHHQRACDRTARDHAGEAKARGCEGGTRVGMRVAELFPHSYVASANAFITLPLAAAGVPHFVHFVESC